MKIINTIYQILATILMVYILVALLYSIIATNVAFQIGCKSVTVSSVFITKCLEFN